MKKKKKKNSTEITCIDLPRPSPISILILNCNETALTLYFIMLKNGQTYFKNFAVFIPQDFQSIFGHFSTLWNKGIKLKHQNPEIYSREKHEYYSSLNTKNNFHWNKLQWPVSTVFHFSFFFTLKLNYSQTSLSRTSYIADTSL